jgi:DNA repair exonuclease SbcCD ATPase subunit
MTNAVFNLASVQQQHERLACEVAGLRRWCEVESTAEHPNYGELGFRVMKLRDRLVDHLDAEERSGCLTAAASAKPELKERVAELLGQHQHFRRSLQDLARRLAQGKAVYRELREAHDELEGLLAELRQHERTETAVLESAFGAEALFAGSEPSLPRPR